MAPGGGRIEGVARQAQVGKGREGVRGVPREGASAERCVGCPEGARAQREVREAPSGGASAEDTPGRRGRGRGRRKRDWVQRGHEGVEAWPTALPEGRAHERVERGLR